MYLDRLQTMQLSFEEICQGQDPWIPLGNFMNDWYTYHPGRRPELVADPLPETYPSAFHQWATFCAAAAEWFCTAYHIPCPTWVHSPKYVLAEPWFTRERESVRQWLLETTPEEFRQRNIFCGNRMFLNKYEITTLPRR